MTPSALAAIAGRLSFSCPAWLLDELAVRYAEPQRRYHTAHHVLACFAARERTERVHSKTVDLALLFHDAVYEPLSSDNEKRSALLLREMASRAAIAAAIVDRAAALVLATRHGAAENDDHAPDTAVVLDADLSILGADEATFAQYERDVRAEYAVVDDASYARGRAHVLTAIRSQRPLYRTSAAQELWEDAGRTNLARSLSCGLAPRSPSSPLAPAARTSGSSRSGSAAARR
jgi:predicted metal-dependent HD superfamily phosphohydrolase